MFTLLKNVFILCTNNKILTYIRFLIEKIIIGYTFKKKKEKSLLAIRYLPNKVNAVPCNCPCIIKYLCVNIIRSVYAENTQNLKLNIRYWQHAYIWYATLHILHSYTVAKWQAQLKFAERYSGQLYQYKVGPIRLYVL